MKKVISFGILLIIASGLVYIQEGFFDSSKNQAFFASPKEVYLALKAEASTAKDIDDIAKVYKKYLTNDFFQENNIKLQSIPTDQKSQVFEFLKSRVVPLDSIETSSILEDIVGDTAVVVAFTKDNAKIATINTTKENGSWKIASPEVWVDNGK